MRSSSRSGSGEMRRAQCSELRLMPSSRAAPASIIVSDKARISLALSRQGTRRSAPGPLPRALRRSGSAFGAGSRGRSGSLSFPSKASRQVWK